MTKNVTKRASILFTLVLLLVAVGIYSDVSHSASLTSVSVTLSNSRPSFVGALASGNSVGSSQITLKGTGYPSTTSDGLVQGDTLRIGNAGSLASHTVTSVVSSTVVNITPALASGDTEEDDNVIATSSGSLTVKFTTANAISNGRFRILVPALTDNTNAADGIPDQGKFDFSTSTPTVTCPSDISGYDFVTGTASASAITVNSVDYHAFECAYSGAGGVGTAFDDSSNDAIDISSLINPAPDSGHSVGTADSYSVIVQHIDSSFATQDTTTAAVGVIEAVRVTASVAPQISFTIGGVASGNSTYCNLTTDVTTTAAAVPFGELSISSFTEAAQSLTVSTNASNGYAVTAVENDQLGLDGAACSGDNTGADCIPDSVGDGSNMSHTAPEEWSSTSVKGFAFTLDENAASALSPSFEFDTNSGNCDGTGDCFRQFADAENSQAAQTIFSATSTADSQAIYLCYRAIVSSTQSAGNYENYITYTATATF